MRTAKLHDIAHTYADDDVIEPGTSSSFELNISSNGATTPKYELTVTGSPL